VLYEPFRDQNGIAFAINPRIFRREKKTHTWGKMFLSQPPITRIHTARMHDKISLWTDVVDPGLLDFLIFTYSMPLKERIVNQSGLTLGQLVTFVEDHYSGAARISEDEGEEAASESKGDDEGQDDEIVFFYTRLGTS
jgi:hypothetical protein